MLRRETHAERGRHALCETSGHVNSGCDVTGIRSYPTRGSLGGDVHPQRNAFNRINISIDLNLGPVIRDRLAGSAGWGRFLRKPDRTSAASITVLSNVYILHFLH